jgi:hypothetical protein
MSTDPEAMRLNLEFVNALCVLLALRRRRIEPCRRFQRARTVASEPGRRSQCLILPFLKASPAGE